jgi:isoquinoline 1-oxidoreductase beta subunit
MMRQGRYRDLIAAKLTAGLDENGMPHTLIVRASGGPGAADVGVSTSPYLQKLIPNTRYDLHELPLHIQTGPYRGPGYNSFSFVLETFIDECAHAAGIDPLEYRLKLMAGWPDQGWTKALKEVASQAGWGKALPKGWGQGIAITNWGSFKGEPNEGTTIAVVATVEVTPQGNAKVHALDVAFDTGRIMNRDAVQTEIEGGTIFGYNMAMNEGLSVKDGRIVEGNFSDYPIVRTADVPKINVHFGGLTGHDRFSEIGEPPVGPVGPAIGNAIFKASGKRLRTTPFRQSELNWV